MNGSVKRSVLMPGASRLHEDLRELVCIGCCWPIRQAEVINRVVGRNGGVALTVFPIKFMIR